MITVVESGARKPLRAIIYGLEGVGKTNFGAKSDKPIFINIEDRIDHLRDKDGNRLKHLGVPKTFDDVVNQLDYLFNTKHEFKSVVIDTADWLERLVHAKIIGTTNKTMATAEGGYGAGFQKAESMHIQIRDKLSKLRDERDMNIIITAHYQVRTVKDPESSADYQAFEIKCHDKVGSMWREWADVVLFARFETFVKDGENGEKTIARGTGKRVIQTEKRPTQQAKNCYGLPAEIPYDENFYENLMSFIRSKSDTEIKILSTDQLKSEINEMFLNISDESMKLTVKKAIDDALDDDKKINAIHKRMRDLGLKK